MNVKKTIMSLVLLGFLAGCSEEQQKEEIEPEETVAVVEPEEEPEDETVSEEAEVERLVLLPAVELNKREIPLLENENGSVAFLGEGVDEMGYFHALLEYRGDITYADQGIFVLRLIFDDGSDLSLTADNVKRIIPTDQGEMRYLSIEESVDAGRTLKRVDYRLSDDEEGPVETIELEAAAETFLTDPVYRLDATEWMPDAMHEDDRKSIKLTKVSLDETETRLKAEAEITFKDDAYSKINGRLYQPLSGSVQPGYSAIEQDFFSGITVPVEIEYPVPYPFGNDGGSIVYLEILDSLFPIDLRTGEIIESPLELTPLMATEYADLLDRVPLEGLFTNQDERVYQALSFSSPYWNYGLGTNEKATHPFILGGRYETLSFSLASGAEYADKGGVYDVYLYADDFEAIQDSDDIKGRELFHHTFKGTDAPQSFEVDVSGVNTLYLYYNTNRKSASRGGFFSNGDEDEQLIQLMMIDPTLR